MLEIMASVMMMMTMDARVPLPPGSYSQMDMQPIAGSHEVEASAFSNYPKMHSVDDQYINQKDEVSSMRMIVRMKRVGW